MKKPMFLFIITVAFAVPIRCFSQTVPGKGINFRETLQIIDYSTIVSRLQDMQSLLNKVIDCNELGKVYNSPTDGCIDVIAPEHEWSGTVLRFRKPDGFWGDGSNLVGPAGEAGEQGACP